MPKVRRQSLPPALFQHLLERIQSRKIPATQLFELLATWLDTEPDVPEGEWYKALFRHDRVRRERADQDISASRTSPERQARFLSQCGINAIRHVGDRIFGRSIDTGFMDSAAARHTLESASSMRLQTSAGRRPNASNKRGANSHKPALRLPERTRVPTQRLNSAVRLRA